MTAPGGPGSTLRPGLWDDYYAPDFVVRVDGEVLDPTTKGDVLQIGVVLDEAQPASFNLTVSDWDDGMLAFKYSSTTTFDPGRVVSIDLGYASKLVRVVTGQDRMRQMANRQPGVGDRKLYRNKTDGEIAQEIAARWNMRADAAGTGPRHALVVQKNQDDATFLMERAKRIDFEFFIALDERTGDEVLYFRPRKDGRDAVPIRVYEFEWGRNLISFSPRLTTTHQVSEVTVRGWDPRAKKPIVYTARSSDLPGGGRRSGPATADKRAVEVIVDSPVLSLEEARRLATSRLMERANKFTCGTAKVIGLPDLHPGDNVDVTKVGPRFAGRYHVTKVTHSLGDSGFTTSLELDRRDEGTAAKPSRSASKTRR